MLPGIIGFMGGTKEAPSLVASATGSDLGTNTSKNITLPSGIQAGDYIILLLGAYGNSGPSVNTPSGYAAIGDGDGVRTYLKVVRRVATGSESGTTVNITATQNFFLGWQALIVRGASDIACSAEATGTSGKPDCPNLSPSWNDNTLWIAAASQYSLIGSQSAPSGYSGYLVASANDGTFDWARVSSAWRKLAASSENPPAYPNSIPGGVTSPQWHAFTIGLKPA